MQLIVDQQPFVVAVKEQIKFNYIYND